MKVVLYLRYSPGSRQTEQSIEGQQRVCETFCKNNGYTIVDKYIDRRTSASKDTEKRTSFLRMIKDSEKHRWQGIVVYKLDRFARNRFDSATYKAKLKKQGVRVISASENISDNPEGIILESVLEGMAEFYSKELSQKVARGMNESALKCNSCGGNINLGYKILNKKYVIDPMTAPVVKQAFQMYADGMSIKTICDIFNSKGYKTTTGNKFGKNSFKTIFKNEKYIGVFKYKDITIQGGMPAIVDNELFYKVQDMIKKNHDRSSSGRATTDYILSGKIKCGHCGNNMVGGKSTGRHGDPYFYYTCSSRKANHTCTKKHIRKEVLEYVVVRDAMSKITPSYIDELAEAALKANQDEIKINTRVPLLQEKLKDVDKSLKNLMSLLENGVVSSTVTERLKELEKEKHTLENDLAYEKASVLPLEKDHIIYWLSNFLKGDIKDQTFQKHIADTLINTVSIWDGVDDKSTEIFIAYNLTPTQTNKVVLTDEEKTALLKGADMGCGCAPYGEP